MKRTHDENSESRIRNSESGTNKHPILDSRFKLLNRRLPKWGIAAILAIMPFHAFLSVYLGSLVGHQTALQAWKELVIAILVCLSAYRLSSSPEARKRVTSPLTAVILAFLAWSMLITAISHPQLKVAALGAKTDLEFLIIFVIAQIYASPRLTKLASKIVITTAVIVSAFAAAQVLFLPKDVLTHFGYGAATIMPFLTVGGLGPVRVLSTLGGPNQLGSYLLLPICLVVAQFVRKFQWWQPPVLLLMSYALWHTYSRSALVGLAFGVIITAIVAARREQRTAVAIGLVVVAMAGASFIYVGAKHSATLSRILLHPGGGAYLVSGSDAERISAQTIGSSDFLKHPQGIGLGSAGPASFAGTKPLITENYFLQVAIETGVIGVVLFVLITCLLAIKLYGLAPHSALAPGLLGALIGISIINLALHGWADSTTALVFWTAAGLAIGETYMTTTTTLNHTKGTPGV